MPLDSLKDFKRKIRRKSFQFSEWWNELYFYYLWEKLRMRTIREDYHESMKKTLKKLEEKISSDSWNDVDKGEGKKILNECRSVIGELEKIETDCDEYLTFLKNWRESTIEHALKVFERSVLLYCKEIEDACSYLDANFLFHPEIPKGRPTLRKDFMKGSENAIKDCEKQFQKGLTMVLAPKLVSRITEYTRKLKLYVKAYTTAYVKNDVTLCDSSHEPIDGDAHKAMYEPWFKLTDNYKGLCTLPSYMQERNQALNKETYGCLETHKKKTYPKILGLIDRIYECLGDGY